MTEYPALKWDLEDPLRRTPQETPQGDPPGKGKGEERRSVVRLIAWAYNNDNSPETKGCDGKKTQRRLDLAAPQAYSVA